MKFSLILSAVLLVTTTTVVHGQGQSGDFDLSSIFGDIAERIEKRISSVISGFDKNLDSLISGIQNFTRRAEEVANCYESQLGNSSLSIFNGSMNFREIAMAYYVSSGW